MGFTYYINKSILNSCASTFILKFTILSWVAEIFYLKEIGGREEEEGGGTQRERIDAALQNQESVCPPPPLEALWAEGSLCYKDSTSHPA